MKQIIVTIEAYQFFSTTYTILSSILLSKLTPCADEIIEKHQSGFRCNKSIANHLFCIRQILEKKWENSEAVQLVVIDLKIAYDSLRRRILYNVLFWFVIPMKLARFNKHVFA